MKNLTASAIHLVRQNGTRASLPACETLPTIVVQAEVVGYLGDLEFVKEGCKTVDFHGMTDNKAEQPFVVSREVFDALPPDAIEFVTPDFASAVLNGLGIPHVIRRFIAKPALQVLPEKPFPASQKAA